jgi:hypothetical protein
MGKKTKERRVYTRVYTKEFKAEAAALAEKRERPTAQIARDLWGQGKRAVPVDTAVKSGGGRPFAGVPRTRTAERRGNDPDAKRSKGAEKCGVKPRFTRDAKKSGRTLVRVVCGASYRAGANSTPLLCGGLAGTLPRSRLKPAGGRGAQTP